LAEAECKETNKDGRCKECATDTGILAKDRYHCIAANASFCKSKDGKCSECNDSDKPFRTKEGCKATVECDASDIKTLKDGKTKVCKKCKAGYSMIRGDCEVDADCKTPGKNICTECEANTVMQFKGACASLEDVGCETAEAGLCKKCATSDAILVKGGTMCIDKTEIGCTTVDANGKCSSCGTGKKFRRGKCITFSGTIDGKGNTRPKKLAGEEAAKVTETPIVETTEDEVNK